MTVPVAHLGDAVASGAVIIAGSGTVFADNLPIAHMSDGIGPAPTGHAPATITAGSGSVFADNLPVARLGDGGPPQIHPGPPYPPPPPAPSTIVAGSGTVFAG